MNCQPNLLTQISPDLLVSIFEFCSFHDVLRAKLVVKSFASLLKNPVVQKRLCFTHIPSGTLYLRSKRLTFIPRLMTWRPNMKEVEVLDTESMFPLRHPSMLT